MDSTQHHDSFRFIRTQRIDSLGLDVAEYQHIKTGAMHYHLAAEHQENVFLVAFRTVPMDSTGVAHILEHTALCGSEKYPVRDPFFMMTRRSLNTFMNAFTSSDWTAYPFASQNPKDFYNLLDVYLDAVFFSRLDPLDFAQEGHRVEFSEPDNPNSPLTYKGVVLNEMKGAMSSPVSTLWQTVSKYLFPTTTYHFNSGGEPDCITDLSYDELIEFYKSHYHPSNAVFMTFGDLPVSDLQQRIDSQALARFDKLDSQIVVEDEKRYHAPVRVEEAYALDQDDTAAKTHHVMGWLLGHSIDLEEQLKAHLLTRVLLDNSASPLRHALESTDLGSAPSPLCGLEDSNREMSFMCGLEGSEPESAAGFEQLVLDTLQQVAEQGVPQEMLEAQLHQLELAQREISGDGYPYGMNLILSSLSSAIHRGDPIALLNLDPVLEKLREQIKQPDFIQSLVKQWLLDNPHRIRVTLRPDRELAQRRDAAEQALLAAMAAQMDEAEKQAVIERTEALNNRQIQVDDESLLPKVTISDVPAEMRIPHGDDDVLPGLQTCWYSQGTNGLVYQQVIFDLPALSDDELQLLPLFSYCLTELGCGDRDYQQNQQYQAQVTGGLHAFASMRGAVDDEQRVASFFTLSGKALTAKQAELTELMNETLFKARFDELKRLREIVAQQRTRKEQSITGHGHSLAMMAASAMMSPAALQSHQSKGLASIHFIKQLDESLADEAALQQLADRMKAIHRKLIAAPRRFLLVAEEEHRQALLDSLAHSWQPQKAAAELLELPPVRDSVKQLWTTSTQVNFCAKAYPTVPVDHPDSAALTVLGDFLRNGYLHRAIREQGGAYGSGAGQDSGDAAFRFFSYRDPRLEETLADFDQSLEWLQQTEHDPQKLEEAILGVVSSIDKPGSPAGEAKQAYHSALFGRTPEQRKAFRQRILQVTLDDLKRVAATYLKPEHASIAVVTSPAAAEKLAGSYQVIAI
ncbi:insulinase family protein [Marinobacterium arenosum]|uniref:insulinase family protein n=1 Tax=Marinobacterium arenosum TaxID=2862496 RepID=UPI001C95BA1E|nr:insulinase family protein [Marinobacterium arenosum]MBY4677844.1 insulinase family protein [Marinobacterium arenosum]